MNQTCVGENDGGEHGSGGTRRTSTEPRLGMEVKIKLMKWACWKRVLTHEELRMRNSCCF
jgi:hypothetical protein